MLRILLILPAFFIYAAAPKPKPKAGTIGRALYAGVLEKGRVSPRKDEKFLGRKAGQVWVPRRLTPDSSCRVDLNAPHPAFDELRHDRGVKVPEELRDRGCQGTVESVTIVRPEGAALSQSELDAILLTVARQLLD